MVRSEQVRTFLYSTESQEAKSEVLSAISDGAVQELVIAGAKLVILSKGFSGQGYKAGWKLDSPNVLSSILLYIIAEDFL